MDDEALPRRAVTRWLGGLGLDVVAVGTVAEALRLLEAERFDVVVADWLLAPPERGDQLLEAVRDRYPAVRRVLFSGQEVTDASCAHFFIEKPSNVEAVERAIRKAATPGAFLLSSNDGPDEPN